MGRDGRETMRSSGPGWSQDNMCPGKRASIRSGQRLTLSVLQNYKTSACNSARCLEPTLGTESVAINLKIYP
jgi:hypothetical protein